MSYQKTNQQKKVYQNTVGYLLVNAIISAAIFYLIYYLYLSAIENKFYQLLYILIVNFAVGIISSWIARIICHKYNLTLNFQYFTRNMISSFIYSIFVWLGLMTIITNDFAWYETILAFIIIKLIIFFVSDFLSDKVSF